MHLFSTYSVIFPIFNAMPETFVFLTVFVATLFLQIMSYSLVPAATVNSISVSLVKTGTSKVHGAFAGRL